MEEVNSKKYFLDKAMEIIDFDNSALYLIINNCDRIWPSGVVLLCSMKNWVETGVKYNKGVSHPTISSSPSNNQHVNNYLSHCGFYDYVGRDSDAATNQYPDNQIVPIKREMKNENILERENEIKTLIEINTKYTEDQIELFDSIILSEVFVNVQEHGITTHDQGWWILAQLHLDHGFISFNVADNGIGFRHSLISGPQGTDISKRIGDGKNKEGHLIKIATTESTSGAYNASTKEGTLFKNFKIGARRGNGLQRIVSTCKELKIELSILSHYGYLFLNNNGESTDYGSRNERVFGGTLYNFKIPIGGTN